MSDEEKKDRKGIRLGRRAKGAKRRAGGGGGGWMGARASRSVPAAYAGKGGAADTRARLVGLAKRSPQVMVKITGGGKTLWSVRRHMAYITREGALVAEDQDGRKMPGKDAIDAWSWIHEGPRLDQHSKYKQALNMVLSMPKGTDPDAVREAARAMAAHEMRGHQWVMVQHHDEPHPHVHLHIKAEGLDGSRLQYKKADCKRWRERFAHELRERGVEAEATTRSYRLNRERINKPWPVVKLEERGAVLRPKRIPEPERIAGWQAAERAMAQTYASLIERLAKSPKSDDRKLGAQLQQTLVQRSPVLRDLVTTRREHELVR